MNETLNQARAELLEPADLESTALEKTLGEMMSHQIDEGEIFFQRHRAEGWSLEDSKVKAGSFSNMQGIGVRAISGEKTGFAFADELSPKSLHKAAQAARSIARSGGDRSVNAFDSRSATSRYTSSDPVMSLSEDQKVELLNRMDRFARSIDNRVDQVQISVNASKDTCFVCSSDGTLQADIRPLIVFSISVIATQGDRREMGNGGCGGRFDLGWLLDSGAAEEQTREAVRMALQNLDAVDTPAAEMPVVLGPGWPGVLLHEAVGHGLEGDFNRKGTSKFSGRMGQKVASDACTVIDDGTLADRRGSLTVDDEGTPTQQTVLIENGVLCGYMQDKLNARLMGTSKTGNGRRESYRHLPMPRMTNTFMLAGEYEPEEIIATIDKGVYATTFSGGSVDITSGSFVFAATEAYLIENGKIANPIRGATLIGDGIDVMNNISMVANDFQMDRGIGTCGKDGQTVPVGVGQPTLKIDRLRVGGTQT